MKLNIKNIIIGGAIALTLSLTSCVDDLNTTPIDPNITQEFNEPAVFAKIYASLARTDGDLSSLGLDDGKSGFYRVLWELNELPTDEALNAWGDVGIPEMNFAKWNSSTQFVQFMYYRLFFNITLCNHYLDQTEGETSEELKVKRAEVRFMRALNYFYAMDMFANVPLLTQVVNSNPEQADRAEIFAFIESELTELVNDLNAPRTGAYGRVDQAAAWTLLGRLYLNAEVYTGTARWADAATWASKAINESGYALADNYQELFMADNGENPNANKEIIFAITFDGVYTQSYAGTTYIIASTREDGMPEWGMDGQWLGNRARHSLVNLFMTNGQFNNDSRAMFYLSDADKTPDKIETVTTFSDGYSVVKWTNVPSTGVESLPTPRLAFADTDIPFIRLAEAYLTFAEAKVRQTSGSNAEALDAVNALRLRANTSSLTSLDLNVLRDEWAREFYFEGRRRIDLIRFGNFGGVHSYNWDWKGGEAGGTSFDSFYNIYPIPASEINANDNIDQNDGYGK